MPSTSWASRRATASACSPGSDRVGLFSGNRPEWHIADFAILGLGAVSVPVYFNESPERMTYILNHSGCKVVFAAGAVQAERVLGVREKLKTVEQVIVAGGLKHLAGEYLRYESLIAAAGENEVREYRLRAQEATGEQLATIIYTSGTTGEPKGVMLTHNNLSSNSVDSRTEMQLSPTDDLALSFLPLAHVYERMMDYVFLFEGVAIAYVEVIDHVPQAMLEVHPTIISGVPRVFEKLYARVMEQGHQATGFRRKVFDWAMEVTQRSIPWRAYGKSASLGLRLQWTLANLLVFSKIHAGLGGRPRVVFSGGAPLAKVEIRIAEDGEILVKGPCVMEGYYLRPQETQEAIGEGGWLRTGDIGYLDADGYLYITDRKKELLKTAAGKFVAPQPIENSLKTSPYILNAAVIGDKRRFISALIVPNFASVAAAARAAGIELKSDEEIAASPWTHTLIEKEIARLTPNLAQYETIKRFALLPEDFTFDNGSLTYTMKLKRRVIGERYRELIERLYDGAERARPA